MAISALTTSTLLLGTAWTGTAPGTASTPSGTINSGSGTYVAATSYTQSAGADFQVATQDGTTFGSAGYMVNYPGLKSGSLTVTFLNDYATGLLVDKLWTMGLGSTVYFDLAPTSAARGASNPSAVGAVILSQLQYVNVQVGNLPAVSYTWPLTGAFTVLTS